MKAIILILFLALPASAKILTDATLTNMCASIERAETNVGLMYCADNKPYDRKIVLIAKAKEKAELSLFTIKNKESGRELKFYAAEENDFNGQFYYSFELPEIFVKLISEGALVDFQFDKTKFALTDEECQEIRWVSIFE